MFPNTMAVLRTIRIRSWTDIVLIVIAAVMLWGLQTLLPKIFPNLSENAVKWITYITVFVFSLIWVFSVPVP